MLTFATSNKKTNIMAKIKTTTVFNKAYDILKDAYNNEDTDSRFRLYSADSFSKYDTGWTTAKVLFEHLDDNSNYSFYKSRFTKLKYAIY